MKSRIQVLVYRKMLISDRSKSKVNVLFKISYHQLFRENYLDIYVEVV